MGAGGDGLGWAGLTRFLVDLGEWVDGARPAQAAPGAELTDFPLILPPPEAMIRAVVEQHFLNHGRELPRARRFASVSSRTKSDDPQTESKVGSAGGELQGFALSPDALAEDCKVENLDTHGARSLTAREARV